MHHRETKKSAHRERDAPARSNNTVALNNPEKNGERVSTTPLRTHRHPMGISVGSLTSQGDISIVMSCCKSLSHRKDCGIVKEMWKGSCGLFNFDTHGYKGEKKHEFDKTCDCRAYRHVLARFWWLRCGRAGVWRGQCRDWLCGRVAGVWSDCPDDGLCDWPHFGLSPQPGCDAWSPGFWPFQRR